MHLLSWNIQCGRGCDGRVDLARIAAEIGKNGPVDVICLQEVARGFPECDNGADQPAILADLFPGYEAVYGVAVDLAGESGRRQFGNLLLSRLPLVQVSHHLLPQPDDAEVKHMRRVSTEVLVDDPANGPFRIVNTHLEYHSERHRLAQVIRLRQLQAEVLNNHAHPPKAGDGPYAAYAWPPACLLCGDFNFEPDARDYTAMTLPTDQYGVSFVDLWPLCHGDRPHDPTCGIHDREQWQQGPHCRDFVFASPELTPRVVGIEVDQQTDASDHQPLRLTLKD